MRLIYFAQPRDHAIPFFIKSNCLPLQSLFFQQSSYLMYDVHTKTAAKSLLNKFAESVQNIIIIRDYPSLLRRGLFVLWGGWGERKRERAGLFPSFPARFLFLSIIDILMGIPSGSLCGGERPLGTYSY